MIKQLMTAATACLAVSGAVQSADAPQQKEHEHASSTSMSGGSKALHDSMMKGMQDMHGMKMTGNVDKDFASMMIHHHQQAIEMSQVQLKQGKSAEVRKKAQEIIDASERDIADLKKWMASAK